MSEQHEYRGNVERRGTQGRSDLSSAARAFSKEVPELNF